MATLAWRWAPAELPGARRGLRAMGAQLQPQFPPLPPRRATGRPRRHQRRRSRATGRPPPRLRPLPVLLTLLALLRRFHLPVLPLVHRPPPPLPLLPLPLLPLPLPPQMRRCHFQASERPARPAQGLLSAAPMSSPSCWPWSGVPATAAHLTRLEENAGQAESRGRAARSTGQSPSRNRERRRGR